MSAAGVITNMNGLDNTADTGGYCGGTLFGLVNTPISGFYADVYNNIVPRDAISGINGITNAVPPVIEVGGNPFGTNCIWHKVRYSGPFDNEVDACAVTGSSEAATGARSRPERFMLVHARAGGGNPVPSDDMWYSTNSKFSKKEWIGFPGIADFPDNGYYILWGKYGIDDAGVNFKLAQFVNNNEPALISVKGVCSF